jgi:hypothetical protein
MSSETIVQDIKITKDERFDSDGHDGVKIHLLPCTFKNYTGPARVETYFVMNPIPAAIAGRIDLDLQRSSYF